MRWITFPDGSSYTLAVDIQKTAEKHGYSVPCEQDGTRHPGTDCNQKMRTIFKHVGVRRSFGVTESSVVVIRADDSPANRRFLQWLVDNGLVSDYYLRRGAIQLYTIEAANALMSAMLRTHVEYQIDSEDQKWLYEGLVTKKSQNLEKKKYKPIASLFNR